jgi:hypothetical protein
MRNLALYFESGELTEVIFQDGPGAPARASVRGKTGGAFRSAGSFQWTSAVKALALLVVKTCATTTDALLRGDGSSLAASLDYAISKQPLWLTEMFGSDQQGICLIRRMILRTNPERKRPGPVTLGINQMYLPSTSIAVFENGKPCTEDRLADLCRALEGLEPYNVYQHATAA